MNLHEMEERDFGRGPALWDADPSVCCAAFQLGACPHTEVDEYPEWTERDGDPDGERADWEAYKDFEDWASEKITAYDRNEEAF